MLSLVHRNGLKTQKCCVNMIHTSGKLETNRDFNEFHHADRGATFKTLRKQIYQPLFAHLQAKEKARLAEQEKFDTVAFTPPVMSDEVIMRLPDKIQTIEQFKNLPVQHGKWSLPSIPRPALSKRDAAGSATGIGRRKSARAVANVRPGTGKMFVNGVNFVDYFPSIYTRGLMMEPVIATEKYNVVDINIRAWGGGYSGQAQAIRQAIGMAFIADDPENRYAVMDIVKTDPRHKERKKTGLLKARKRPQWKRR